MPPDLASSIAFLEETNDPAKAYFSYTVDASGENGMISANKEGLRLYAAALLQKSLELEKGQDNAPLYFHHHPWLISETGYDLICGILPRHGTRAEILKAAAAEGKDPLPAEAGHGGKGCLAPMLLIAVCGLILFAARKAFPTLQLWANILLAMP